MQLLYKHAIWNKVANGDVKEGDNLEGSNLEEGKLRENEGMDAESYICSSTDDVEIRKFARTLYNGAMDSLATSDELIAGVADKWKIERIASIDLAILRLAIFELNEMEETPPKVILNEAIELAKKYSTAQSGSFLNGLLDRLLFLREGTDPLREDSSKKQGKE